MKKILAALALAAALAAPVLAQTTFNEAAPAAGQPPAGPVVIGVNPVGAVPAAPQAPVAAAPAPGAPATTQNTVTTTGPVTSETTISVGTIAGQVFLWVMTAFGGVIGTALTTLIVKLIQRAGIQATDALRARLQGIVVNGLNLAAQEAATQLKGKLPINVNAEIKARATEYVMAHGADTIKALGIDPHSAKATEAVHAHIETAIADPATPTPTVLDKPKILS